MIALASLAADPRARTDPTLLKAAVDRRLRTLLPTAHRPNDLGAALQYSLLAPGKRIRPLLTLLTSWEVGGQDFRALDAGCALEMVHAASLILDDLPAMDDARERRGQPATHIKFGEDVAMLGAITLLSMAYGTVSAMDGIDPSIRCALVGILAKAVGIKGLAGGQYADLRPMTIRDPSGAADANHQKTGALFVAAVEMAAAIHRLDEQATAPLRFCAAELGQAYQILDDLTDDATLAESGRSEDAGKTTILSLVGRDAARLRLRNHVDLATARLRPSGPLAEFVRGLFESDVVTAEPA